MTVKLLHCSTGSSEVFPGSVGETAEEVLCKERADELPDPYIPSDGAQCGEFGSTSFKNSAQLGTGDR